MPDLSPSITCPMCGMVSYHPKDIEHRYCGKCHAYHRDLIRERNTEIKAAKALKTTRLKLLLEED